MPPRVGVFTDSEIPGDGIVETEFSMFSHVGQENRGEDLRYGIYFEERIGVERLAAVETGFSVDEDAAAFFVEQGDDNADRISRAFRPLA